MALIAAVVPTLGTSPHLEEAVRALRRERGPNGESVQVIVVHPQGACPPAVADIAELKQIATQRALGFAAATNLGIAAAHQLGARWIATVNDDLRVTPGWAASLIRALEADPDACAAQGVQLRLDDPTRVDGCGLAWNRSWQAVQLRAGEPPPSPDEPESEIFGVSATAAVYRTEALVRASALAAVTLEDPGPFERRLVSYYEDVELACRLRATGARALLVPRARALHAGSATGRSMALRRWRWIYGNRLLVLARLLGGRFLREAPRTLLRDARDLARAAGSREIRQSVGIVAGWGRALRRGPAFAHRGEPLVPLAVLERFRISSGHS